MEAALVILDGWGRNPDPDARDAVAAAETPNFDRSHARGATSTLTTFGRRVGLPDGQMGNSEVGHLNIGAGRVVKQATTRITDAVDDGSFFENERLLSALEAARANEGRVHFMGLVSDGGVHASLAHLKALVELAADHDVPAVTHAFTDGRDTPPKSAVGYIEELQETVAARGTGEIASVSGRYYAMDRDRNWERTHRAYEAIVDRTANYTAASPRAAVEQSYERGDTDEFVEPTCVAGRPDIQDGDAVVFFNFRADRARQLTRMLADIDPEWPAETNPPEIELVTMTEYDATFDLPVAFPPHQPEDVLGEVLTDAGRRQLRIAETEKYAHVTYFLNGGREVEFPGEIRRIVPSPDVATYDQQPEMSAAEVTDTALAVIDEEDPDALVLNYANPDMVGHTGDFDAAVAACEAVDAQLGRLVERVRAAGGHLLITADHGNADDMGTPDDPHTAHTKNPVPVVYLTPEGTDGGRTLMDDGSLCNLAPAMLELLGIDAPPAMTGASLFVE
jgi:2,3-bisphosphoglycerate-independent phosphoglycerate mutase